MVPNWPIYTRSKLQKRLERTKRTQKNLIESHNSLMLAVVSLKTLEFHSSQILQKEAIIALGRRILACARPED